MTEKEKSNENFSSMKRFKVKAINGSANNVSLNPLSVVEKHRYRYFLFQDWILMKTVIH